MAVVDGLDNGIHFGPGDLKIQLQRGQPTRATCKVGRGNYQSLQCSSLKHQTCSCFRRVTGVRWATSLLGPTDWLHKEHQPPPPPLCTQLSGTPNLPAPQSLKQSPPPTHLPPSTHTSLPVQLIDYQKLPGGGRSLFNTAGGESPSKTEAVELRVYVRKGGKLKYELDGLRWKSSYSDDGTGEGPPTGGKEGGWGYCGLAGGWQDETPALRQRPLWETCRSRRILPGLYYV